MRSAFESRCGRAAAPVLLLLLTGASPAPAPESSRVLELDEAQRAALAAHPDLESLAAEQRARDAALRQAGARPNPELSLEVEDLGGSGEVEGVDEAETTLRVLQPIELGGDRAARIAVATGLRDLASFDAEARRLDLLADVANAFVEVLIAQEELHHAVELLDLSREERAAASLRVRSGAALALEETRARIGEGEAQIHVASGESRLATARRALAERMGAAEPEFERAAGDLDRVETPPPLESLLARIGENPDLARFAAERREREAVLALARAKRVPDPAVGAGARHYAGSGDSGMVFQVVVPLPLFDRHEGAVAEASERVAKLGSERAARERTLRQEMIDGHARWAAAASEVRTIREALLPDARRALGEAREAWRSGRSPQLELIAAYRTEFENVDRMLHMLGEYHQARITCERLAGGFVASLR